MDKVKRRKITPVAVLVLLVVLLTLLVFIRRHRTTQEAVDDAAQVVVKLEDRVVRDKYAAVAFLGLMALLVFVMWTALRAKQEEDKATPPARESSGSDTTELR
jgi:hypothetical protein